MVETVSKNVIIERGAFLVAERDRIGIKQIYKSYKAIGK